MKEELKPCKCRSKKIRISESTGYPVKVYKAVCYNCGRETDWNKTPELAIEDWNHRTDTRKEKER